MSLLGRGRALDTAVLFSKGYKSRKALDFDGVDEYVNIPSHSAIDNLPSAATGFSVGGWIYARTSTNTQVIVNKRISATAGWRVHLYLGSGGFFSLAFRAEFSVTAGEWRTTNAPSPTIPFNTWVRYLFTFDGSSDATTPKLYVNGVDTALLLSSNSSGTYKNDSGEGLTLASLGQPYNGLQDDVFIANRILNQAEATEDYNAGHGYDLSRASYWDNVVAWWKMGDGDIYPTITDHKGSSHGTMTNMESTDIVAGVDG